MICKRPDLDVAVIGGGPAGSACAIELARAGARVALIEASDFSRFRIGETLEPSAGPLLRRLGIEPDEGADWSVPCAGVSAAWGQPIATHRPIILNPYRHGWRVDRRRFDRALFERARNAGATAYERSRLAAARRVSGAWELAIATRDGTVNGRAAWVVTATGRRAADFSAIKRRLYLDRLIGIAVIRPPSRNSSGGLKSALVEAGPAGWWYSAMIPDGRRLHVFFTDSDLLPRRRRGLDSFLRDQLRLSPLTHAEYGSANESNGTERWIGFDARSSLCRLALSDGWLAIGDAAFAFDPLCGRGVTEALASACAASDWLQRGGTDRAVVPAWIARAVDRFNIYCAQRLRVYGEEMRWPASAFWQRRHAESLQLTSQPHH